MNGYDPRTQELLDLARAENLRLPMPVDMILYFENMGYVVDLISGEVYREPTVKLEASGKAVAHLLAHEVGAVAV
jgi:hypothetical protein